MDIEGRIERLIAPTVETMGFDIVRVLITGQQRRRLQIMVERQDGEMVVVEDCAKLSREISAILDVEDPLKGAFTLELSSPGIDRPLVRLADFERFAGLEARVETSRAIEGRRRFVGRLLGIEGEVIRLRVDGKDMELPYADVKRAKLILTDELIAASREQQ